MTIEWKIKILFGILIVGLIAIGGWFITNLGEDTDSFTYVNDKLKNKLGEEVTSTGTARMLKGYYIEHNSKDLDCLFIEDTSLIKIFSGAIGKEITVKGTVERKVTDYGECIPTVQMCGKHLEYCIKVENIETKQSPEYKATIRGKFTSTKGCMGVVNGTLLTDFANKCDEAAKYEGKLVEVTGSIYEYKCEPHEQCFDGPHMKNIESIKIIE